MPEPSTKSPKAYQFMFVLYPESQQPAIDYIQANWPCAWALHDKDTHTEQEFLDYGKHHDGNCPDWQIGDLKKPHYHFVVKFKNARYITGVAKEIRKYSEINDAAIKKCYNLYKAYVYLWHQNDPDKFQYDPEQVVGLHDFDPPQQNEGVTEEEQVETMFNAPVFSTVKELARWAYADDAADPAQADSAASSDEVVVPPEEGKVVQVQGVQTYDPQLYERMDKLQESIDALTEALIPAAEGAESSAEDAGGQDYTSQLSTISGQLVSLQEAVVMSTPESAEEPNIWDKPFNEYTPLEGYALLTFVIILAACGLSIFRRF